MNIKENIDWLSVTFPYIKKIHALLPAYAHNDTQEECRSPIPVYQYAVEFKPSGIKILRSQLERLGVHMIVSGKPLRLARQILGVKPEDEIWDATLENGGKVSRIDFALDVLDCEDFTVEAVKSRHLNNEATTRLVGNKHIGSDGKTETYYIGNMKSKSQRFRVYNKAVESNIMDRYWVRIEFEKRKNSHNAAKRYFEGKKPIRGIISSVVDFPDWDIWGEIMNVTPEPIGRGESAEHDDKSRLDWILNSACPAIAKEIVRHSDEQNVGLYDNEVVKIINTRLASEILREIRKRNVNTLTRGESGI